jgi:IS605 OrfB family transposase
LSGRERRFQTWLNHVISYQLIQIALTSKQAIALEDLTGIRERTNELSRSKTERRRSNSWSFYQLRQFLFYKSIKFGVKLHLVNPRYTSKSCHCCGVIGNRQGKKFSCVNLACGWVGDADENGSKNISALGAAINPHGGSSTLFCLLQDVVLRATENPNLSRQAG